MVFSATFKNILAILWWSVLLVEETEYREKTTDLSQVTDKLYFTQEAKDRATGIPLKTDGEVRCSGRVSSSCSTCDTRRVTLKEYEHHMILKLCWTKVYVNKFWYLQTFL
jgi:hypothetical protein